jgi:hypothetical protein
MRPWQRQLFDDAKKPTAASDRGDGRERVQVRLWLLDDSREKSVHMLCAAESDAKRVWVPRSLMGDRISKRRDPGCAFSCWEFTLPLWKAEELGIGYE